MIFLPYITPNPALRPYIRRYFLMHVNCKGIPAEQRIRPMPPDGEQCLYFYARDAMHVLAQDKTVKSPSSIVLGCQTSRVNLNFGENHLVIQVAFQPTILYRLLGIPIYELSTEPAQNAEYILSKELAEVNQQLQETVDYPQMIAIIECFLLKKIQQFKKDTHPIDLAIATMSKTNFHFSLDYLADQACLSPRQFERKFYERMGISPKLYSRIIRFDKAYKMKLFQPQKDWLDVAYACNYFDFTHLLRDFRQFAEVPPSLLIQQQKASIEGWAMPQ